MGKFQTVIHINGKPYDATSGALLVDAAFPVRASQKVKSVDGFVPRKPAKGAVVVGSAAQPTVVRPASQGPRMASDVIRPVKHATKHQLQGSQTLMRSTVKKPAPPLKRHVKVYSNLGALVSRPDVAVSPKQSAAVIDTRRAELAKQVAKSPHVKKFTPTPAHENPSILAGARPATHQPLTPRSKSAPKQQEARTTADILQQAIEHANGHEQPYASPKRGKLSGSRRVISFVMVTAAVAALIVTAGLSGFTSLKLRMASAKAGFDISKPAYQPSGFNLADLSTTPGSAGLHFESNSDTRNFSITEKLSQWDSSTLHDMVVKPSASKYQTVETAGRTIYIDENNNATWVNGGIWYQVKNDQALTNEQIVELAKSL